MGLHRDVFPDRAIAEMMGPLTGDGQSLLWEYFGRRFIPLSYAEADKHCQKSREFISALLPKEDVYLSLLPPEARDVVGQVGEETVPAKKLLENLGFAYRGFVDPFDGGPHLEAKINDLSIVKATRYADLAEAKAVGSTPIYVSVLGDDGEFRAVETEAVIEGKERGGISRELMKAMGWKAGMRVGVTVLEKKKGVVKPVAVETKRAPGKGRKVKS
jgi:arginine N-succinyltransferase